MAVEQGSGTGGSSKKDEKEKQDWTPDPSGGGGTLSDGTRSDTAYTNKASSSKKSSSSSSSSSNAAAYTSGNQRDFSAYQQQGQRNNATWNNQWTPDPSGGGGTYNDGTRSEAQDYNPARGKTDARRRAEQQQREPEWTPTQNDFWNPPESLPNQFDLMPSPSSGWVPQGENDPWAGTPAREQRTDLRPDSIVTSMSANGPFVEITEPVVQGVGAAAEWGKGWLDQQVSNDAADSLIDYNRQLADERQVGVAEAYTEVQDLRNRLNRAKAGLDVREDLDPDVAAQLPDGIDYGLVKQLEGELNAAMRKHGWESIKASVMTGFDFVDVPLQSFFASPSTSIPDELWDEYSNRDFLPEEYRSSSGLPKSEEVLTFGQYVSAVGAAINQTFNPASSGYAGKKDIEARNEYYGGEENVPTSLLAGMGGGEDFFSIINRYIDQQKQLNEREANLELSPEERDILDKTLAMLAQSGPQAADSAIDSILNRDQRIAENQQILLRNSVIMQDDTLPPAMLAAAAVEASQAANELARLQGMDSVSLVEENINWAAYLSSFLFIPDPTDILVTPVTNAALKGVKQGVKVAKGPPRVAGQILTPDNAEEIFKAQIGSAADELAKAEDAYKEYTGQSNWWDGLLARTRRSSAEHIEAAWVDMTATLLGHATTPAEARAMASAFFDGTLWDVNPNIGRSPLLDPELQRAAPVLAQAKDQLLNAASLAGDTLNRTVVQGEWQDIMRRHVEQQMGLSADDVFAGTTFAAAKKAESGSGYRVHYYADGEEIGVADEIFPKWTDAANAADDVNTKLSDWSRTKNPTLFEAGARLVPNEGIRQRIYGSREAKRARKEAQERAKYLAKNGADADVPTPSTRGNIPEPELGAAAKKILFTPSRFMRGLLSSSYLSTPRNAIRNAANAYLTIFGRDGGASWDNLDTINHRIGTIYGGSTPYTVRAINEGDRDLINPEVSQGFWTFGGKWKKLNPMDAWDQFWQKTIYGTTEVNIGGGKSLAAGEEAFRGKTFYRGWDQAISDGVSDVAENLAAGLRDIGVDPEYADAILGTFERTAKTTDRNGLTRALKEVIGAERASPNLKALGADPITLGPEAVNDLTKILATSAEDTLPDAIDTWVKATVARYANDITANKPVPGAHIRHSVDQARDAGEGINMLTRMGRGVGMEPAAAEAQARGVMKEVVNAENDLRSTLVEIVAVSDSPYVTEQATVLLTKMYDEKKAARAAVDKINRTPADKMSWDEKYRRTSKVYEDYRQKIRVMVDDANLSSLTPLTADEAAKAGKFGETVRTRYDLFDAESNEAMRRVAMSQGATDDDWNNRITAGRAYVDHALDEAFVLYTEYPSPQFLDAIVNAQLDIEEVGYATKVMADKNLADLRAGRITPEEYYTANNDLWNAWAEFGHHRARYATVDGLRNELGAEAADVIKNYTSYAVPPDVSVDDLRRMGGLAERGTAYTRTDGNTRFSDKRLLNSINKEHGYGAASLDDLTPDQRTEAFTRYLLEAEDQGIDVATEWYRYRTPDVSAVVDMPEAENFYRSMWNIEMMSRANGYAEPPTISRYVTERIAEVNRVARNILDNPGRALGYVENGMDSAVQAKALLQISESMKQWDDVLYGAIRAGQETANRALLNYRDRRGFDEIASLIFPFHFFFSRSLFTWAQAVAQTPSVAHDIWRYEKAVQGDSEQYDGPTRTDNTMPNPVRNVVNNLFGEGTGDFLPERVYNILRYAVPYWPWNDFSDPEEANNGFERSVRNGLRLMPGLHAYLQYGIDAGFDRIAPLENGWNRTADYQISDFAPLLKVGAAGLMAATGRMGAFDPARQSFDPGGKLSFLNFNDQFTPGRVGRAIRNGVVTGDYDPTMAQLTIAYLDTTRAGLPPTPEMQENIEAINDIATRAAKDAGYDQFSSLASSYLLALPGQMVPDAEKEFNALQEEYYKLGYSYQNTEGSRLAQDTFAAQETSGGVPFSEARDLGSYYNLYGPPEVVEGESYTIQAQRQITDVRNEEMAPVFEAMTKASFDYLLANMDTPLDQLDLDAVKKPFWDEINEIKEKYPSASESDGRFRPNKYGMNPYEAAQEELFAMMRYEPPGKPEWRDDFTIEEEFQYYADKYEYDNKRLNVIERIGNQWVQGDDTPPSNLDGELVNARAVIGRYAQELIDTYELRHASGLEVEYYMRNQFEREGSVAAIREADQAIHEQFGADGYAVYKGYSKLEDAPKTPDNPYGDTDEKRQYREDHPELKEMQVFGSDPEFYNHLVKTGGDDIFAVIASYPGGGSKSEKSAWYKRQSQRQIDATHAYFTWSRQNSYDLGLRIADNEQLAANWSDYSGSRPIGSNRHPIGMAPFTMRPDKQAEWQRIIGDDFGGPTPEIGALGDYHESRMQTRTDYLMAAQPWAQEDATGKRPQDQADMIRDNPPEGNGNWWETPEGQRLFDDMNSGRDQIDIEDLVPGVPGLTAPPATKPDQLPSYKEAMANGVLAEWIDAQNAMVREDPKPPTDTNSTNKAWRSWRRWNRWRRYGYRRRGGRRRYRSYGRGRYRGSYRGYSRYGGGGYGGGGAEEAQPLYLRFQPAQVYAREFGNFLMPSTNRRNTWRPDSAPRVQVPRSPNIAASPNYNIRTR